MSIFLLVSAAEETGLNLALSETLKTGFSRRGPNFVTFMWSCDRIINLTICVPMGFSILVPYNTLGIVRCIYWVVTGYTFQNNVVFCFEEVCLSLRKQCRPWWNATKAAWHLDLHCCRIMYSRVNAFYHLWTYPDPCIPSCLSVFQLFCWSSDNSCIRGEYSFTKG